MIFSIVEISEKPGQAFIDGLLPSLLCILIVFVILTLIYLIVALLNKVKALDVKENKKTQPVVNTKANEPTTKLEDIQDDDTMAAVLVATIDYQQEIQNDVRLVRVKRIG